MGEILTPCKAQFASAAADWLTVLLLPHLHVLVVAFLVSLIMTPVMRHLALRNGIVDWPDLRRKSHARPVAYLGGVAIFLGWFAGVSITCLPRMGLFSLGGGMVHFPFSLIIGAAAITLTGLFDDVYGISPRVKTGGQLFAAAALASETAGLHLAETSLDLLNLHLPESIVYLLGTVIIAVFVLGGCNSLNLIDGLDGLAAGVSAIAALGFLTMAYLLALQSPDVILPAHAAMHPVRIVLALAILGAALGFLPYNFNPASIFMGDAGSLLLGYLCISNVLLFAEAGDQRGVLLVAAGLIVFALPITDTSLAILRRKMRGQPIFSPDNGHIHHLLRRSGLSVKQTTLTLYGVALIFASLGCLLVALRLPWHYVLLLFAGLYVVIMFTAYRYGHRLQQLEQQRTTAAGQSASVLDNAPAHGKISTSARPEAGTP